MVQNVLLITVDSLRYDSIPETDTTDYPTLSDIRSAGVSFEYCFATGPGTTPSFPALLTGTYPLSYGGLGPLSESRPRVSSHMRSAGLETAAFHCNPFLSKYFNYDHGYNTFKDYQNPLMGIATKIFPRGIEINNPKLRQVDEIFHITDLIKKSYELVRGKPRPYVGAEVITEDTIEWLSNVDEPFFCWTHYMDVHHPCYPPERYRSRYNVVDVTQSEVSELYSSLLRDPSELSEADLEKLRRLYRAAIAYTEAQIGRLVSALRDSGMYDDTLIIVTSDHGELFGDHGQYGKPERMYDELLRVPLFVLNAPDYASSATEELVSLLDVPPLMHDALGQDVPETYEGQIPGRNEPRQYVLAEHEVEGDVVVGVRSDQFLYEVDQIRNARRLFRLCEQGIVQIEDGDVPGASTVRDPVADRLASLDVDANYLQDDFDGEVKERLEDLGYL